MKAIKKEMIQNVLNQKPKPTVLKGKAAYLMQVLKNQYLLKVWLKRRLLLKKQLKISIQECAIPETKIPIRGRRDRFAPPGGKR
jgi:hypothetical protein